MNNLTDFKLIKYILPQRFGWSS